MKFKRFTGVYLNDRQVLEYTIKNEYIRLSVLNFGCAITELIFNGKDVVLGFDNLADYFKNVGNLGIAVIPNGNRIKRSEFNLDGKKVYLEVNNNFNNLHSHSKRAGQKQFWDVELKENEIVLTRSQSEALDYFPGNREYSVTYRLVGASLEIEYSCISDKKTVFNPTQHTYFNLNGHDSGTILTHKLQLDASHYTATDRVLIPTGELTSVEDTPMDFRNPIEIGKKIYSDYEPLKFGGGYDHNFCLDNYDGTLKKIGSLEGNEIVMNILTDMPGIQVYTGNNLGVQVGKGKHRYQPREGVALETQYYPDNLNHDNFPSSIMEADERVTYKTVYSFEVK